MSIADILRISATLAVTASATDTVREAVTLLGAHRTRMLVICDEDGTVSGVLSDADIVQAMFENDAEALEMSIEDFMIFEVHTCNINEDPQKVLSRMFHHNVQHFPVIENGQLAGVVTSRDIFNYVAVVPITAK